MKFSERLLSIFSICRLLIEKFIDDRCTTHAASLAFSSTLSIVPILAVLFAVFRALNLQDTLAPVITANLAAGSHDIVNGLQRYISNTAVGSLGFVGLVAMAISAASILGSVENAFNEIWQLSLGKKIWHKLFGYLVVLISIPALIALALSITTALKNQSVIQWLFNVPFLGTMPLMLFRLVPYLSIWIALFVLYKVLPNTKILTKNALIGSVIVGTFWQIFQVIYISFQIGVSRYNAIYGTLALLPVFMMWVYTSWLIVLAGMEFIRYLQEGLPEPENKEKNP